MTNPELDAWIAENVMEWKPNHLHWMYEPSLVLCNDWHPTTSIADAWAVVEKMRSQYGIVIAVRETDVRVKLSQDRLSYHPNNVVVSADTAPLAICKAAKAAKGGDAS